MSKKNLGMKKVQSMSLFALDFQNRMCELREKAKYEGALWIEESKNKKNILTFKEKIFFKEFSIQADLKGRMYLLKKYASKNNKNELYRFKIEFSYQLSRSQEKVPFYYYITLEK
jgi:hypothetical protein